MIALISGLRAVNILRTAELTGMDFSDSDTGGLVAVGAIIFRLRCSILNW